MLREARSTSGPQFLRTGDASLLVIYVIIQVYANDLNPRSIFWLKTNIQKNRLGAERKKGPGGVVTEVPARVLPFNLDARLFIRLMCGEPFASYKILTILLCQIW